MKKAYTILSLIAVLGLGAATSARADENEAPKDRKHECKDCDKKKDKHECKECKDHKEHKNHKIECKDKNCKDPKHAE